MAALSITALPGMEAFARLLHQGRALPPAALASEEEFWAEMRANFHLQSEYINLENGYYCLMPKPLLEEYLDQVRKINLEASYYLRNRMEIDRLVTRQTLAEATGVDRSELIVTRNTTESLDLVISGIKWQAGDEAIMARQDYGAMLHQFRLMEERHGIKRKIIDLPHHPQSDAELVALYEQQITDKTRLIMVCHLVNITGQVLPVRQICDMAHRHGVAVMVDGAHSFAHLNFKIPDLGCDYFGTSLHKWLSAPLGSGLLWVKKDKIPGLTPLFAEREMPANDILRLNHMGTIPIHAHLAIPRALEWHQAIGSARKLERLRYLKRYWTEALQDHPNIEIYTPWEEQRYGAIANVGIKGYEPANMAQELLEDYGIWTVAIDMEGLKGCRITPHLYTTTQELDQLVAALLLMAKA